MEWLIFLSLLICGLMIFFIRGILEEKKKEKEFLRQLKENYGKNPDREYEFQEYEVISRYYKTRHQEGFTVDDLTWEDLGMDFLYKSMNYTMSSAGDEYFYYLLRTPFFSMKELKERERLISYFMEKEEERRILQNKFHKMGRTKKASITDYLNWLENVQEEGNLGHYTASILLVISLMIMAFSPSIGVLLFIGVVSFNIKTYLTRKGEIGPYLVTFAYILRMLKEIEEFQSLTIPGCEHYLERMMEARRKFQKFQKGSYILMSSGKPTGSILEIPLEYMRMFLHIDLIKFNKMLKQLKSLRGEVEEILFIIGYLESMISIGAFRKSLPYYTVPQFSKELHIHCEGLAHPLLENPVSCSLKEERGVLVTGSNASGKSTFLKAVAVNILLAQTIHTVYANYYEGAFVRLYSSMSLRDNLLSGESYYMAEIKALKRILDASKKEAEPPVFCFVDEVLRGTNTIERIAASSKILKTLTSERSLCFAATHDVELTYILESIYTNYHFEEEVRKEDIYFSYELHKGRAMTRNAIKLLKIMGYENNLVQEAEELASHFIEKGYWESV